MTEDEMAGWHHRLNGHEFEQAPRDGEGKQSLACCRPWGHKEQDMTEQLNSNHNMTYTCTVSSIEYRKLSKFFFYLIFSANLTKERKIGCHSTVDSLRWPLIILTSCFPVLR